MIKFKTVLRMISATKVDYDMRKKKHVWIRICCCAQRVYVDADYVHCFVFVSLFCDAGYTKEPFFDLPFWLLFTVRKHVTCSVL